MPYNPLTPEEKRTIIDEKPEYPGTGAYDQFWKDGTYICRQCNSPLYTSDHKFDASCGWPSFEQEIPGAVINVLDKDGERTEVRCAHCNAHLGHVFTGEHFTSTDTRHCVNSLSMRFIATGKELPHVLNA